MPARLFTWLRRHPQLVDLAVTLPLVALSLLVPMTVGVQRAESGPLPLVPWPVHVLMTSALFAPLIWRRKWPRAVFATVALAAFGQWLADLTIGPHDLAVMIAMYTVAAHCAFRWVIAAGLVAEFGAFLAVVRAEFEVGGSWQALIPLSLFVWATCLGGLYIGTRRKYTLSLEERAARLERERDAEVQVAAAAERARIAREMHDVVAHAISVMVVQADGASCMVDTDAERARRAMQAIGATGRQALTEMRRMLGVLRDGRDGRPYTPQPGIEQLAELVEQIRSAGLPVDLTVEGVPAELPAGLQLTVYRIVQEALTNARKHAGTLATARVALCYGDHAVEVRICDDGRGAAADGDGHGHGLVGMRERVAMYGGMVRAQPRPGGGFEVVARLPVKEEVPA